MNGRCTLLTDACTDFFISLIGAIDTAITQISEFPQGMFEHGVLVIEQGTSEALGLDERFFDSAWCKHSDIQCSMP